MPNIKKENKTKGFEVVLTPRILEEIGITLGKTIGFGNCSKVKLGYTSLGSVAVKIINIHHTSFRLIPQGISQELECLRTLSHPNVIKYIQHVQTEYSLYIVMELAEHGTVLDELILRKKIGEIQARRWFKQLLDAVSYCHGKGVVHRDIKCENLMLGHNLTVKLADFGFARAQMKLTSPPSQTFCGSLIYSAPEILLETPYIPQYADVWSMGVVLYCMIYGQMPFSKRGYERVIRKVQCKVRFPKSIEVSAPCKHLIDKMVAPLRCRVYLPGLLKDPWVIQGPPRTVSVIYYPQVLQKISQLGR